MFYFNKMQYESMFENIFMLLTYAVKFSFFQPLTEPLNSSRGCSVNKAYNLSSPNRF